MPEQLWINAIQLLTQQNQVANCANGFRCLGGFDNRLEQKIAGAQKAFQRVKDAMVLQTLKDIVDRKQRLDMLCGRRFQPGIAAFCSPQVSRR